ncbi:hypothetical protein SADUNF_Sadunf19G0100400 [Salix dunnii]|uniref:ADP-ribosyl cyclase/cyclic ADP-ribose hydrolase n=1 Tax=Salix dunnii TaxID=1413687 RepID=A0A835MFK7_9ROSI|nr:hypothetical protein SADUNF_Sadunf19G0100400 [Salix dunnii]
MLGLVNVFFSSPRCCRYVVEVYPKTLLLEILQKVYYSVGLDMWYQFLSTRFREIDVVFGHANCSDTPSIVLLSAIIYDYVGTESEFIEKIVGDVLNKLHGMSSSHTSGLVGIDVRVNKVESLLNMESQDVVIVGIWGMGGIGKTTIADAVCNKDCRIKNALRISYDGLDEEQKSIFVDIAHFFRRFEKEQAARILDGFYRRSVIFDISTLIDKCLLTTSHNKLEIHDLLQELAFNIVRAESYKSPGKRSRLCHLPDVVQVMEENKVKAEGTEEIEGIYLDISKLSRQIHLKPDVFAMMVDLKFLNYSFGDLSKDNKDKLLLPPTGLQYLSNKLVYFHWDGYPSKSLPQRFCAEHLVELNLRYSKVEKLWTGVQDIGNLRNIVLFHSQCLKELPDLSKAKKLVCLKLMGCSSLTKVPSSLQHLDKLEELDLRFCSNLSETAITEVPSSIQFPKKLSMLNMRGCSKITKFPEVSGNMETLILYETAITEVPSSIQFLKKLEVLDMSGCSKLESFPKITEPMEFLEMLHLNDTRIKEIPSLSFKHMISLRYLSLSGTLIKELPLSIKDMVYLLELDLDRTLIKTLPELPPSLTHLSSHHCESLETTMISTSTIGSLWGVLNFANCIKLDKKPLIAAIHLKIQSGENARDRIQMILPGSEIPEWFGDKGIGSSLTIQMPSNCHQLKGIAFCVVFLLPLPSHEEFDTFRTYLKCHVESKNDVGAGAEVFLSIDNQTIFRMLNSCHLDHMFLLYQLGIVHPLQDYSGKEVTFKFYIETSDGKGHVIRKPYELKRCGLKGIAFCLVFLLPLSSHDMLYGFDDHPEVHIYFDCHVKSSHGDGDEVFVSKKIYPRYNLLKTCNSDHMFLHYELGFVDHFRKYSGNEVTFKFYNKVDNGRTQVGHGIRKPYKLKSCGVKEVSFLHIARPARMPQKILLCGWRRDIDDMIVVSSFVKPPIFSFLRLDAAGSELWMFNDVPENEREKKLIDGGLYFSRLENIQLVNREGNANLILADESVEDSTIQADSRSLATLLLIRDIQSKHLPMVNQVRRGSFHQGSRIGEMPHVEKCLQSAENVALFIEHLNFEFLISRNKTLVVI